MNLAALTEDRFLLAIGRRQRFGSQMGAPPPTRAGDNCVLDSLQRAFQVLPGDRKDGG
jgi:hypothetical protein